MKFSYSALLLPHRETENFDGVIRAKALHPSRRDTQRPASKKIFESALVNEVIYITDFTQNA